MATSGWFVVAAIGELQVHSYSGTEYTTVLAATKDTPPLAWGPYATESAADTEMATLKKTGVPGVQTTPAKSPLSSLKNPLDAADQFLGNLANANTWIRVGEVLLGLILIAIGVAELTHAVPIATSIAKTAGKTAGMAAVAA